MTHVHYGEQRISLDAEETVLDALLREGHKIPNSCRTGACQSCLVRAVKTAPPPESQKGLPETQKARGYFLACQCQPDGDLWIEDSASEFSHSATVISRKPLSLDVMRIDLAIDPSFEWSAGQYIHLTRPDDGLTRPYSVASRPQDGHLELHIRRVDQGRMSSWIFDELQVGYELSVRGPSGDCIYIDDEPERPLLLVGVGTGLAPLIGILRDAIDNEHKGPILLVHGGFHLERLYMRDELMDLASRIPNFKALASVVEGEGPGVERGEIGDVLRRHVSDFTSQRAYLCGDPKFVSATQRMLFLEGMSSLRIHADAFVMSPSGENPVDTGVGRDET